MINSLKSKTYNFLRYTQKYTGTDNVYLARGGFWLGLRSVAATGGAFLLAIAFANLLDQKTYGSYQFVLSVIGILAIFTLPGIGISLIRSVARGQEGSYLESLKIKIIWGLGGSVTSLGISGYYFFQDNQQLALAFLVASAFIPLFSSFKIYNSFLGGRKLFSEQAKYLIIFQFIYIPLLIGVLFLTNNFVYIVLVYLLLNTFVSLVLFLFLKKRFPPNISEDPSTIPYGKYLTLTFIIPVIAQHIDKILLFHFLGAAEVAIYAFANAPLEMLRGLVKNIVPLSLPKFAQRNIQEIKQGLFRKIILITLFVGLIIGIYILIAPSIFKIFFPLYQESIKYSQILSLILLGAIPSLIGSVFLAHKAKKEIATSATSIAVFQIVSLVVLGYYFGFLGIILARIISPFFNLLLLSLMFLRFSRKS